MIFADRGDGFINRGTFTGGLFADAGDDTVDTSAGRINGYVDLGDGADQYVGGAFVDDAYGGAGADTLTGGAGADFLDGGLGADTMDGGHGDDGFGVDEAGDTIVDSSGFDTVYSSINYTLGADLEALVLVGSKALDGIGNADDNLIIGNTGANRLSGGDGNDSLFGDAGLDVLTGGAGADRFYFDVSPSTGYDRITDFSAEDFIFLNIGLFSALAPGTLGAAAFRLGTVATTTSQRILYDLSTGNLYYDADGSGAKQAIRFATVTSGTQLSASNFVAYGNPPVTVESSASYNLPADKLDLVLTGSAIVNGTGNEWDNRIVGNKAANLISGLGGADWLTGGDGSDTVSGGSGDDNLSGDGGADTLDGGVGNDMLTGGQGIDTATYATAGSAVTVNLELWEPQETGGAGRDILSGIENSDWFAVQRYAHRRRIGQQAFRRGWRRYARRGPGRRYPRRRRGQRHGQLRPRMVGGEREFRLSRAVNSREISARIR